MSSKRRIKDIAMVIAGVLAVMYMMNPTLGIFELLPDNLPFVGNIDEAAATTVLIGVLGYFGITLPPIFSRPPQRRDDRPIADAEIVDNS